MTQTNAERQAAFRARRNGGEGSATPGITDEELLRRAVTNARGPGRGYVARWVSVMSAFGLGSTYAWALVARFGLDPDERVRR